MWRMNTGDSEKMSESLGSRVRKAALKAERYGGWMREAVREPEADSGRMREAALKAERYSS